MIEVKELPDLASLKIAARNTEPPSSFAKTRPVETELNCHLADTVWGLGW